MESHRIETLAEGVTLIPGDCLDVLKALESDSVDACVTDPPYHLTTGKNGGTGPASLNENSPAGRARISTGFMGKAWDGGDIAFRPELWREVLRVLRPGAHLLAFGGTRTYHRMACAIEDAGFEIRDSIQWLYGSGFPKSLDVSRAIDKARDDRQDILRVTMFVADAAQHAGKDRGDIDAHMGTSDMAGWWTSRLLHRCQCPKWDQWLQLKILLGFSDEMDAEVWRLNGRKGTPGNERHDREVSEPGNNEVFQPTQRVLNAGTPVLDSAAAWSGFGTALKPACEPIVLARKPLSESTVAANVLKWGTGALNIDGCRVGDFVNDTPPGTDRYNQANFEQGYRPDAYQNGREGEASAERRYTDEGSTNFAATPGPRGGSPAGRWPANVIHDGSEEVVGAFPETTSHGGGTATYGGAFGNGKSVSDATAMDRFAGDTGSAARFFYTSKADSDDRLGSKHPTVKPVDLIQYLVRLVTPPKGLVLDPFAGTGTLGEACIREGRRAILIEREAEYCEDIRRRMRLAMCGPAEREREAIKAKTKDKPVDHGPLFGGMDTPPAAQADRFTECSPTKVGASGNRT